jgi:hypothetical protein
MNPPGDDADSNVPVFVPEESDIDSESDNLPGFTWESTFQEPYVPTGIRWEEVEEEEYNTTGDDLENWQSRFQYGVGRRAGDQDKQGSDLDAATGGAFLLKGTNKPKKYKPVVPEAFQYRTHNTKSVFTALTVRIPSALSASLSLTGGIFPQRSLIYKVE